MLMRLSLRELKTLPMIGPRIMSTAKTTIAIKTRINAYSTRPWPLSFKTNNMAGSPFSKIYSESKGTLKIIEN
jgi:hypothetical protein